MPGPSVGRGVELEPVEPLTAVVRSTGHEVARVAISAEVGRSHVQRHIRGRASRDGVPAPGLHGRILRTRVENQLAAAARAVGATAGDKVAGVAIAVEIARAVVVDPPRAVDVLDHVAMPISRIQGIAVCREASPIKTASGDLGPGAVALHGIDEIGPTIAVDISHLPLLHAVSGGIEPSNGPGASRVSSHRFGDIDGSAVLIEDEHFLLPIAVEVRRQSALDFLVPRRDLVARPLMRAVFLVPEDLPCQTGADDDVVVAIAIEIRDRLAIALANGAVDSMPAKDKFTLQWAVGDLAIFKPDPHLLQAAQISHGTAQSRLAGGDVDWLLYFKNGPGGLGCSGGAHGDGHDQSGSPAA